MQNLLARSIAGVYNIHEDSQSLYHLRFFLGGGGGIGSGEAGNLGLLSDLILILGCTRTRP